MVAHVVLQYLQKEDPEPCRRLQMIDKFNWDDMEKDIIDLIYIEKGSLDLVKRMTRLLEAHRKYYCKALLNEKGDSK